MDTSFSKEVNPKDTMADEIKKEGTVLAPEKGQATVEKEWEKIVGGKYKNEEELAKAYKDLEGKLTEQGKEVGQAREFASAIEPLINVVRDDPEVFSLVDRKLREKTTPKPATTTAPDRSQKEVRDAAVDLIIAGFEGKKGIDQMAEADRRKMRNDIGAAVSDMTGQAITQIDLRRLGGVLENAYFLANKDKITDKAKLEALLAAQGANEASISGVRSSSTSEGSTEEMTPEEANVATKMGLTREQYLEGKKQSGR